MENFNKVIIGTANFSEDYKILDQKKTFSSKKISSILADSKKLNIDTIDTSYNYRGVESKLGKYNLQNWKIITKLPKLNLLKGAVEEEIFKYALISIKRLNIKYLNTILLSDISQIFTVDGHKIMEGLIKLKEIGLVKQIGFSVYFPREVKKILKLFKPDVIQLPYSVIDRRFEENNLIKNIHDMGIEIHARSIFLQGLLITTQSNRAKYFNKKWKKTFTLWDDFITKNNLDPIKVCMSYVFKNKYISKVIIGLDTQKKLQDSVKILKRKITYPENFCKDENLLIPYKWNIKSMKSYLSSLNKSTIDKNE